MIDCADGAKGAYLVHTQEITGGSTRPRNHLKHLITVLLACTIIWTDSWSLLPENVPQMHTKGWRQEVEVSTCSYWLWFEDAPKCTVEIKSRIVSDEGGPLTGWAEQKKGICAPPANKGEVPVDKEYYGP